MKPPTRAAECAALIGALYGEPLAETPPLLHVTALWRAPQGPPRTLRITADTPRSAHDRFALGLARARVDAILTTGKILREEPALRHRYLDDAAGEAALAAWRRSATGRATRPLSVVLSSGRGIDWNHPLFHDGAPVLLFTGRDAAERLGREAPSGVRVEGHPAPDIHSAVAFLHEEGLCVSVEAGASTSAALYGDAPGVDELMLSEFVAPLLPAEVVGPAFVDAGILTRHFRRVSEATRREPSGTWCFSLFRKRDGAGAPGA